ncbi:MAG: LOG family protein [Planctomycetota bacterium]
MAAITVYCASSSRLAPAFHQVAEGLGRAIGHGGHTLVYGGGRVGLMGEIGRATRAAGGRTVGIITTTLVDREQADRECHELIVVETMRRRKTLLAERADAFVVLPGGIGTYEEFFEILVGRKLHEHDKPIGVVNSHGYFNPLVAMIEHGIEHGFIQDEFHDLVYIHPDVGPVLERVLDDVRRRDDGPAVVGQGDRP